MGARTFRLVLAATGHLDRTFMQSLRALWFSTALWQPLPLVCLQVDFRALAFRCLSRMACAYFQLITAAHQQFPIRMFALLQHPDLAPTMVKTPPCLLDAWSAEMLRRHPTLDDEDFKYKLLLCASLQMTDISAIEARHATIRRILTSSSVQTHQQSFAELVANWVFLQARVRQADRAPWSVARSRRRTVAQSRAKQAAKRVSAQARRTCLHQSQCVI